MKKLLFTLLFVISGLSGTTQAANVYHPDTGMLDLPTINMIGIGYFCGVRLHLDGSSWSLLEATACATLVAVPENYDPVTEILSLPRLNVPGAGDVCNVQARFSFVSGRWELLSVSQCTVIPDPGACTPTREQFNKITVGMIEVDGITYSTGTTLAETIQIMGCQPVSTTEETDCTAYIDGSPGTCTGAAWLGADQKEISVLYLSTKGSVAKTIMKTGFGAMYLPNGMLIPLP